MSKFNCDKKQYLQTLKPIWLLTVILLFGTCVNQVIAQQISKRGMLIEKTNTINQGSKIKISDTTLYDFKKETFSLKEDLLNAYLKLKLTEKNREHIDLSLATSILGDLLQEDYDYLKKHPKLLLLCYLNLGRFYLSQHTISKASLGLSNYYFGQYFQILKSIPLTAQEVVLHQENRLNYLEKTQNDSLFYYLDHYDRPQRDKNQALARWYRFKKKHKKELYYAKKSVNQYELLIAYKNNFKLSKVDSLYPLVLEDYKHKNRLKEHVLYLKMGERFAMDGHYDNAEKLYLKALTYFENKKNSYYVNECLGAIINIKVENGDVNDVAFYNTKLNNYKQAQHEEQLIITEKYLSFVKSMYTQEIKTQIKAENLEKEHVQDEIKYQKTITSAGIGFFLVFSIFIFFYFQSINERNFLEFKNEKMKVDILRSKFKPHFTFNVLSVINYFIAKEDLKNASLALTKMANLLRSTLDNMNKNLVSYESEYKICEHYMYLEYLRFSDKFDFKFEPLNDSRIKDWKIPPGIIEPFLENCVNHGFKGGETKGIITLEQRIENNNLVITVRDNGVGIDTEKLFSNSPHGLKITQDVVKATSDLYKKPIGFEIENDNGTVVKLTIPVLK